MVENFFQQLTKPDSEKSYNNTQTDETSDIDFHGDCNVTSDAHPNIQSFSNRIRRRKPTTMPLSHKAQVHKPSSSRSKSNSKFKKPGKTVLVTAVTEQSQVKHAKENVSSESEGKLLEYNLRYSN